MDSIIIRNNTIDSNTANTAGGIYLGVLDYSVIVGNVITRNYGVSDYGIYLESSSIGQLLQDYNDVWQNHPSDYGGSGNVAGPNSISANPLYKSPPTDFALAPSSPCIDAGDPDPQFNDPDGTRSDMGAFPYQGSVIGVPDDQPTIQAGIDAAIDGDTDVFDVVRFVNVAFHNQPPESNFCDPSEP